LKGRNYRHSAGMPYTRKEFARGSPHSKIAKFSVGSPSEEHKFILKLISNENAQIRHNSLEAARVSANKKLASLTETDYHLVVKVYPHIILRENKMIATAGADRLQEGMRKAFGKPVGLAARVKIGSTILELSTSLTYLDIAKDSLKTAASKLPIRTRLDIKKIN
jgi:large subunit ribosomal protein L10e